VFVLVLFACCHHRPTHHKRILLLISSGEITLYKKNKAIEQKNGLEKNVLLVNTMGPVALIRKNNLYRVVYYYFKKTSKGFLPLLFDTTAFTVILIKDAPLFTQTYCSTNVCLRFMSWQTVNA
jgi:hypothetical protein